MSDIRVLLSAVLLAMGVSAAVSAGFVRYAGDAGPRIVTVRLAELAADFVLQASGSVRSMDGAGGTALADPEYDAAYVELHIMPHDVEHIIMLTPPDRLLIYQPLAVD